MRGIAVDIVANESSTSTNLSTVVVVKVFWKTMKPTKLLFSSLLKEEKSNRD